MMGLKGKRYIFWTLITLFVAYSYFVDTMGTAHDRGEQYLTTQAKQGKLLFQKYNCTACHQLFGLGGYMGPDLTNVMSQQGKGEAYVNAFLASGTERMPNFGLSEIEKKQLISFLNYADKTGVSPVSEIRINNDGSINLPGE